jgi:DNA-binding HxlR family transcriptional regulator
VAQGEADLIEAGEAGVRDIESSVGGLLEFLGSGATGPILMALGPRPLRTKRLTERVPTYSPRTLYRQSRKLAELGLIERRETTGVPSSVIHSLSDPAGRDLVRLLDSYATAMLPRLPAPRNGDGLWTALGLIGTMWASGWVEELSLQGRSATELSERTAGLTFHQVSRRTQQLVAWGLLSRNAPGQGKRYQLTDHARRGVAMAAAIGRWQERHLLGDGERGLRVVEMAVVLRACLPLVELPEHPGRIIKFGIVDAAQQLGQNNTETLSVKAGTNGRIRCVKDRDQADAWALCTVNSWLAAILDGDRGRMRVGGDLDLVDSCLKQLHNALWADPERAPVAALV